MNLKLASVIADMTWTEMNDLAETIAGAADAWVEEGNEIDAPYVSQLLVGLADEIIDEPVTA